MAIVFKSISNRNPWIILKNATLAVVIALSFALDAKAEDIKTTETLQVSCNPFSSNDLNVQCHSNLTVEPEVEQVAQTRRGRRRKSKVQGYYGGFSLGVGFPSGEIDFGEIEGVDFKNPEYTTAFIGSLFGGIKFTKNIGTDLEFLLALGGVDSDSLDDGFNEFVAQNGFEGGLESDGDFSAFALYINPKFELPLSESGNISVYIAPGIGLSQTNVNFEAKTNIPNFTDANGVDQNIDENQDASKTGITFQIKSGASIGFSDTLGAFAQIRYATLPTDDGFDSINFFGADAGLKFNF